MITTEHIDKLAELEMIDASIRHGKRFNSDAEAYAVIKEEIEEAWEEMTAISQEHDELWYRVRHDKPIEDVLRSMMESSKRAIQELLQVNAMARKARHIVHHNPELAEVGKTKLEDLMGQPTDCAWRR